VGKKDISGGGKVKKGGGADLFGWKKARRNHIHRGIRVYSLSGTEWKDRCGKNGTVTREGRKRYVWENKTDTYLRPKVS